SRSFASPPRAARFLARISSTVAAPAACASDTVTIAIIVSFRMRGVCARTGGPETVARYKHDEGRAGCDCLWDARTVAPTEWPGAGGAVASPRDRVDVRISRGPFRQDFPRAT